MELVALGVVLPWIIVAFGCWLGYQLVRQNGRIILRLEALEERLSRLNETASQSQAPPRPSALPVGSAAPDFELPDVTGTRTALSGFRGKRVLLIFFNPGCRFCIQMAPDLAALPTGEAGGRPLPLVISTGDAQQNRKLVAEYGIRCRVLLQEGMEVATQYQAHGTPMGYLIDEQGHIASEIAVGSHALLALADGNAPSAAVDPNGYYPHKGNRALSESKLNRNGLPVGTPAPSFILPTLDGAELSLEAYRGRKVLLVFSDPKCGPCQALAPQLEQAYRHSGEVQVLMVSRGDLEANRKKVEEHGLTIPIVLQKQWEISRAYAMFATPVAYLIDEEGVIRSDVATGADAIKDLLARAASINVMERRERCRCGKPLAECGCGKNKTALC